MPPSLNDYKVQGFVRTPSQLRRLPLPPSVVKAVSERAAIATYARCNRLKQEQWDNSSPEVLIMCARVSKFETSRDSKGRMV